jgi:hypothetical protein
MSFTKIYIAKGKQVQNFDIVSFNVRLEDLAKIAHEYNDEQWVSFEVMKLKAPDQFGRTHTLYTSVKSAELPVVAEKVTGSRPAPRKPRARKTVQTQPETADCPF